jgi:hypothetical protein
VFSRFDSFGVQPFRRSRLTRECRYETGESGGTSMIVIG